MARKAQARPRTKELRKLYRGLITTSIVQRVETLKTVLQWYDQAYDYVVLRNKKQEATPDQWKLQDKMLKARRLGISSVHQPEKETAFRTAIQIAEGLCKILHPYPVEKAWAEYERYKARVERRRQHLANKYGTVMTTLEAALKPLSAMGEPLRVVVDEVDKDRGFSRSGDEYIISRKAAKQCQELLRQRGVLPLVVQEAPMMARAAALEDDGEGHFKVNPDKQVDAMCRLYINFAAYCSGPDAPRRLVKSGRVHVASKNGKGPKRTGAFGHREKVDGLFVQGSKIAFLYQLLTDSEWHTYDELRTAFAGSPVAAFKTIRERGQTVGWKVEEKEDQIRMVKEMQ
jgi:hypothetical protein